VTIVAIDGPAGAGKSSAALRLAERLGYTLIDTGALYRAVALAAREQGVSWEDGEALGAVASSLELRFGPVTGGRPPLLIDGRSAPRCSRCSAGWGVTATWCSRAATSAPWCSPTRT